MISATTIDGIASDARDAMHIIERECPLAKLNLDCHQNSYLVFRYLQGKGHVVEWMSGRYYIYGEGSICHSWIWQTINGKPAFIIELDPYQLAQGGGYEQDPMPSQKGQVVLIYDDDLVEPCDECPLHSIKSKEVLSRFAPDPEVRPTIDCVALDALLAEALDNTR